MAGIKYDFDRETFTLDGKALPDGVVRTFTEALICEAAEKFGEAECGKYSGPKFDDRDWPRRPLGDLRDTVSTAIFARMKFDLPEASDVFNRSLLLKIAATGKSAVYLNGERITAQNADGRVEIPHDRLRFGGENVLGVMVENRTGTAALTEVRIEPAPVKTEAVRPSAEKPLAPESVETPVPQPGRVVAVTVPEKAAPPVTKPDPPVRAVRIPAPAEEKIVRAQPAADIPAGSVKPGAEKKDAEKRMIQPSDLHEDKQQESKGGLTFKWFTGIINRLRKKFGKE